MPSGVEKVARLKGLAITEISVCDFGANQHAKAPIVKSAAGPGEHTMTEAEKAEIEKARKAEIAAEVQKALADERAASAAREAEAIAKAKKEAEDAAKSEITKAGERIAALEKAAAIREQVEVAKSLPNIEGTTEANGDMLWRLAKAADAVGDKALYGDVVAKFRTANVQIEKGGLFKTAGTRGGTEEPESAAALAKAVSDIQKRDPSLSREQATVQALAEHPDLYTPAGKE